MTRELKGGYTTGACVAAGAKAGAIFALTGERVEFVEISALNGEGLISIPVKNISQEKDFIKVEIIKNAGDDPDITNGISIFISLRLATPDTLQEEYTSGKSILYENILLIAGEGIGYVTKEGLGVAVGEPAINPGPRRLIVNSIRDVTSRKCIIKIDIPGGKALAEKTLNPVLGIVGGISIIGTTGVLRPMSEEAFKNALVPQIDVAKAQGAKTLIFVPGKIGERIAIDFGLPKELIIQTSNFIGFMLEKAAERNIERILLFGHIGKLAKVAAGVFHTHNRMGDGRLEALAAYSGAAGMPAEGIRRILAAMTTEEALPVIKEYGLEEVFTELAQRASLRSERLIFNKMKIGTVLVTLKGELLGMDSTGEEIGRDLGWKIKL